MPAKRPSMPSSAQVRRQRIAAIAAIFVFAQFVIAGFGAAGVEGINILRAYAAGEAQWSKAQKRAIISLFNYAASRSEKDMADFRADIAVTLGDRAARLALESASPDIARAKGGFLAGLNSPDDVGGLAWGFVLFHRWAPFAEAVEDWRRADGLVASLSVLADSLHEAAKHGAPDRELYAALKKTTELDRRLTVNEQSFSYHMGEASRIAKNLVLVFLAGISALIMVLGALFIWRIASTGAKAEERAEESEARVRDFAELAADWFCELDRNLRLTDISNRFYEIGLSPGADLKGCTWAEAGRLLGFSSLSQGYLKALRAREPFRDQRVRLAMPDGREFFWSMSGKPRFDSEGAFAGYRIAATNITALIRAQNDLTEARDEAERANRAKSRFLANMGHELRTPLNAVLGFSELIEHQTSGPVGNVRYVEYARDIHGSGRHLLNIINNVLELSRIEAGGVELQEQLLTVEDVAQDVVTECREAIANSGAHMRVDIPQGLPAFHGDARRMRQVLSNLLSNAVKFTPAEGTVALGCRRTEDGGLVFHIRDTGIGMSEEGVREALRPFGQADIGLARKFEGVGLGLPLAKKIVELHGGTLRIESVPDRGTSVSVALPSSRVVQQAIARVA